MLLRCIFLANFLCRLTCGGVSLFIFLEKMKQKSVVALESLRFQGRSPRQCLIINLDYRHAFIFLCIKMLLINSIIQSQAVCAVTVNTLESEAI